ncbi:MAG: serine/threonine protein kinase [bacterium]|nr:serine/threonine protein kinase [bacterium]
MTARARQLKEIVTGALEVPAPERDGYLGEACGADDDLRREAASFLELRSEAGDFLEDSPMRTTETPFQDGDRIGAYRVLRPIGSGGMGDVYLAERADGTFERDVAIKVIRSAGVVSELLERFVSERQLLAELDHPNIARLLDGGTTDDGRPYLVMEHVEGRPIDEYCEAHGLSVEERLRLFLKVCAAVQHAHRHLVVHRDLKPANILVTTGGEPKLLDFGVAKEVGGEGKTPETRLLVPVTPEYASPEQLTGKPATTAVDVYALGVVLYELLTGQSPFGDARDPFAGRSRTAPPTRPSRRIQHLGARTARRLRRRLVGDLDHLVLRALEPDPARRFPSVERFAAELERHLAGQPLATREGRLYRLGKIARRRWKALVAAAALMTLAGLGLGEMSERRQLEREAERVGRLSEELGNYIEDLFAETDPVRSGERNETLERILDHGAMLLASESLTEEPLMRARLLGAIGQVYRRRDLAEKAEPLLRESLTLRRQHLPPDDEWIAVGCNNLATMLRAQGRYAEARNLLLEAGDVLGQLYPADHPRIATQLNNLAGVEKELGMFDEAVEHYSEALEMKRRLSLPPDAIAKALKNLGVGLRATGRLEEAESAFREALDELSRLEEPNPAIQAGMEHHLGSIRRQRGDRATARGLLERAHATRVGRYGESHEKSVETLLELAVLDRLDGRFELAEEKLWIVLEVRRRRLGREHPQTAAALVPLARLLAEGGDVESAHALAAEAVEIFRTRLPGDHWRIAEARELLNEVSRSPNAAGSS